MTSEETERTMDERMKRYADTVMVAPGQRIDVLVRATEPGAWAWHCHVLNHAEVEQGMFGMVTAVTVEGGRKPWTRDECF
jgi:FtsP/CotA-like multicopper oxidase with cupredoxin domain